MVAITSVFIIVLISLIVTLVATVTLIVTGLSRESARFQARSALSGVGFTTSEAEAMLSHPIRRRVVMFLMLFGSAGILTVVASLIISSQPLPMGATHSTGHSCWPAAYSLCFLSRAAPG